MSNKTIYLCLAHMSEAGLEQKYIQEAFDTNWVVPLGPNVNAFEKELEKYLSNEQLGMSNEELVISGSHSPLLTSHSSSLKNVAALGSGTAAVHLGLLGLGVGSGDEVICQSFTFCASVNPVVYLGAKPVFVDSEAETYNMDPDLLESAIKDRIAKTGKKPKAIVPVHLYGMPAQMDRIMEIANRYGIAVMEDAAEAMGSTFDGQLCGTFGQYGVWSFNGNKMITTSGGGALICPSEEAKRSAIFYATQAKLPTPYYQHEQIGFNYRLSNICAGIGRGQMTVLDDHIAHHRHVHDLYVDALKDVKQVQVHCAPDGRMHSNYWLTTILLDPAARIAGMESVSSPQAEGGQPNDNVEQLRHYLSERGVESRPLWKPMHLQPVFQDCPAYVNGVSESLFQRGLCLPSGPMVSDDDVKYIVECIKEAIGL